MLRFPLFAPFAWLLLWLALDAGTAPFEKDGGPGHEQPTVTWGDSGPSADPHG